MKTEKNILIAFLLNLGFSVFEFAGGMFTGSIAIVSDAIHDAGDAVSIGASYFLERKSRRQPDETYTYGYARYSVFGSILTTLVLLLGSAMVICHAVGRMIAPTEINYDSMIVFAVVGVCVNFAAAFVTRGGGSLNQKAVNLHMLEDVLGWAVVLVGAIIMRFTDISVIDPIMSVGVSLFMIINGGRNLKESLFLLLEKAPRGLDANVVAAHIEKTDGVLDVHHVHVWSMNGQNHYATMHIVTDGDSRQIKERVREKLRTLGISHATLELEKRDECCNAKHCHVECAECAAHSHHHHHHHH